MQREKITSAVQDIFRDVLDNPSLAIQDGMTASDIDGWDSLAHISIITAIEKQFAIRFSLSEIDSLACIGDMIDCAARKSCY